MPAQKEVKMLKTGTITKEYILGLNKIADVDARQVKINEIVIAFASGSVDFASSDCWSEYYELVHKRTNVSNEMRKKAFFNAHDSQLRVAQQEVSSR